MILRDVWEQYSDESCLYEHHTICGNIFKYFNIEYVKWLEGKVTKLQPPDNKDYAAAQEIIICKWLIDQNMHVSPIGRADLIKRLNSGKPNSA